MPYFEIALRKAGLLALALAVTALAGCKLPVLDPETDAVARAVYTELRTGSPEIQTRLAPELRTPASQAELANMRALIPPGEPSSGKAVGWNYVSVVGQGKSAVMSHEYDYPGKVVLAQVSLRRPEGTKTWSVDGAHIRNATTEELDALNFSLFRKSPAHYIFLTAMVASLALMLAALIKVVRTKGLKRKWLWVIASLFCAVGFDINWFSGAVAWKANFGLINAGVLSGNSRFDPWILSFCLPIGAILILAGVWAKPKPVHDSETPAP